MNGMENKRPLLSICIPTYNRAEILDKTLFLLFSNPDFNVDEIEVVVSDNCSTDHTKQIVNKYPFVKYFCNEKNVRDANFSYALQRGSGEYLKLLNDTVRFPSGSLKFILDTIKKNISTKDALLFYERRSNSQVEIVNCDTLNQFIAYTSFYTTWISNFGLWRQDLYIIKDIALCDTLLLQVAWSYKLAQVKSVKIYFGHYFIVFPVAVTKKRGYNVFEIFIKNYLGFSRRYLKQGTISYWTFEKNKFVLFYRFIAIRVIWLMFHSKNIIYFNNQGSWKIILKEYSYCPYFWIIILCGSLWYLFKKDK